MNKKYEKMAKDLSEAGRFGDTRILHVNEAELAGLGSLLPSGKLPTNPETGQPEAGIITAMVIGAILGGTSGGITAKQKNIPLWQGILQGAGIGAATGALTGGLTAGLGEGASAGAQASVDAGTASLQETTAQTLQAGIEQGVTEGISEGAKEGVVEGIAQGGGDGLGKVAEATVTSAPPTPAAPDVSAVPTPSANPATPVTPTPDASLTPNTDALIASSDAGGLDKVTNQMTENLFTDGITDPMAGPPDGAYAFTPDASASAQSGILDQLSGEFTKEALADSFSREALKEYASNPLNYLSPVMATEALTPVEYDEEDYLAGYQGPYDKTWSSAPGVSWAANDGGEVKKRSERKRSDENLSETPIQRVVRLANLTKRIANPTLSGRYNPLSDEPVQLSIRPNLNPKGMHRVGVTFPFNEGGLASIRRS